MKTVCRSFLALATAGAAITLSLNGSPRVAADITATPGMEIHQGETVCTLGLIETRLRLAVTVGKCNGAPTVTDSRRKIIGTVVRTNHDSVVTESSASSTTGVEYEVISIAANVHAMDLLATGRRLEAKPGLRVHPGLSVCRSIYPVGEACGRVVWVSQGRFVVDQPAVEPRGVGGPVYALVDDNRAVILGLVDTVRGSSFEAQSWHAVMEQVYADTRPNGSQQTGFRLVSLTRPGFSQ